MAATQEIQLENYTKTTTADCDAYDAGKFGYSDDESSDAAEVQSTGGFSLYTRAEAGLPVVAGNIINAIIGSGIIALPVSFSYSGMGMSTILLALSAIMGDFTILCLCVLNTLTQKYTYQQAVKSALGDFGYTCCAIFQFIYSYSAIASYGIASADNLIQIFSYLCPTHTLLQSRPFIALFYVVPVMFFSFYENVARLGFVSLISISCVIIYVVLIFARSFEMTHRVLVLHGTYEFIKPSGIPISFSVIAFAMSCQQTVGRIYHSMHKRSIRRFSTATHFSSVTSLVFYMFVAIIGFMSFGGNVQANLLQSYCADDKVALAARVAFTITLLLSSPMQVICARESITTITSRIGIRRSKIPIFLVFITLGIVVSCYFITAYVKDLGLILSLSGSAIGANMVFTIPALSLFIYLRKIGYCNFFLNIGLIFVTFFGIAIMIIGVTITLYNTSQPQTEMIKYWCYNAYTSLNNTIIMP